MPKVGLGASLSSPASGPLGGSVFADLTRFFAPRSVAMVGATEDLSKFGGRCMRQTIDFGFAGAIYPINPKRDTIFGQPCFASVADLPEAPDHVGIVLPAHAVPSALEQCAERGVPFVTIFSSGFGELGTEAGWAAQQRIVDIARAGNIRMMGPNCNGMVNFVDGFALTSTATIQGPRRAAGDLGVVSQSGGAGQVNVMWRAQQAGMGVSYQVSCGNACDLDLMDYAAFMLESEATKVVAMLVESISDGERLRALAERSYQLNKPIVMVKVGRTDVGSRAAASHTGSVTGADDVCDAALRQIGIIRVDDCNELYETAMLLRQQKPFKGRRAAATSISGGNLVMLADLGAALDIEWPQYQAQTCEQLAKLLPGFGATSNPTDLTAGAIGQPGAYAKATEIILQDPSVDVLIPVMTITNADDVRSVADVAARSAKPMALLWTGCTSNDPQLTHQALVAQGHAVYSDAYPCLKAVRRAMQYSEFRESRLHAVSNRPADIDRVAARRFLEQQTGPLTEQNAKKLLSHYGVRVTQEYLAHSASEAVKHWSQIKGTVTLKIVSPDILHKTEAQAIRLNLDSEAAVSSAYEEILVAARKYRSDARIEGVLVQEMVGQSHEMFIGMVRDPTFGAVITFGLGGIYVEVLKDLVFRLAPLSRFEIAQALNELRAIKLLQGARGQAPADIEALIDCIERVSWLAADCVDKIAEIDINPLCVLALGQGVRVVDALVIPIC